MEQVTWIKQEHDGMWIRKELATEEELREELEKVAPELADEGLIFFEGRPKGITAELIGTFEIAIIMTLYCLVEVLLFLSRLFSKVRKLYK